MPKASRRMDSRQAKLWKVPMACLPKPVGVLPTVSTPRFSSGRVSSSKYERRQLQNGLKKDIRSPHTRRNFSKCRLDPYTCIQSHMHAITHTFHIWAQTPQTHLGPNTFGPKHMHWAQTHALGPNTFDHIYPYITLGCRGPTCGTRGHVKRRWSLLRAGRSKSPRPDA